MSNNNQFSEEDSEFDDGTIDNSEFVSWLESECKARGIKSWRQFSEKANTHVSLNSVSGSTLSNIKKNKRRPGDKTLRAIAEVLNVPQVLVFKKAKLNTDPDLRISELLQISQGLLEQLSVEDREWEVKTFEILLRRAIERVKLRSNKSK